MGRGSRGGSCRAASGSRVSRGRGRALCFTGAGGSRGTTLFAVADRGRVVRTVCLRGAYELETLSPDGNRLFLIHWRDNGYDLETYRLTTGRLRPTVNARVRTAREARRAGVARGGDARWALAPDALPEGPRGIRARARSAARDRPLRRPSCAREHLTLGAWGVVLSQEGRRLYVVKPIHERL